MKVQWEIHKLQFIYSAPREEKQKPIFEVIVNLLCHGTC